VSADHSTIDYDHIAGKEGTDSHSMVDSGNAEVVGCGSID